VAADPHPDHLRARQLAEGPAVISHPDAEAIFASLQMPETERGMKRVLLPSGKVARSAEWRRISLWGQPLAKKAACRFSVGFVKKEIEPARGGVGIHLLVPTPLFAYTKPLHDAPVFFRGQTLYGRFDFLNSAHT
jgi:hypothetical protein